MKHSRLLAYSVLLMTALAAALAVLPARWLNAAVPSQWPLAIVDAEGTVWSGTAGLALGPESNRRRLPDPITWHWSFSQGPRLHIQHAWLGGPLMLAFAPRGVTVSSQTMSLPAQALATLDPRLAAIGPQGQLRLSWPAQRLTHTAPVDGARLLDVQWLDAASALSPLRPLGQYTLNLTADKAAVRMLLSTQKGPLVLQGTGRLDQTNGLNFEGSAQADASSDPVTQAALQDVLNAMGPRQNNLTLLRHR